MNYKVIRFRISEDEEKALRLAADKAYRRPEEHARYLLSRALGLRNDDVSVQPISNRAGEGSEATPSAAAS